MRSLTHDVVRVAASPATTFTRVYGTGSAGSNANELKIPTGIGIDRRGTNNFVYIHGECVRVSLALLASCSGRLLFPQHLPELTCLLCPPDAVSISRVSPVADNQNYRIMEANPDGSGMTQFAGQVRLCECATQTALRASFSFRSRLLLSNACACAGVLAASMSAAPASDVSFRLPCCFRRACAATTWARSA